MENTEVIPQIIISAANRHDEVVIAGARHFDPVMNAQYSLLKKLAGKEHLDTFLSWPAEQGFIDQFGKFYTRGEAKALVIANKQPLKRPIDSYDTLYSENLY